MRILGVSDHFTSGAAVIEDGRIVAAVNEERLARMKMVMGFPRKSIAAVLDIAGVRPDELDLVAIASEWGHFLNEYVDFSDGVFGVDEGVVRNLFFSMGSHFSWLRSKVPILERLYYDLRRPVFVRRRERIREVLREEFEITCPVEFISHHLSHAAAAYMASGYDDALLVTMDGAGDGHSRSTAGSRDCTPCRRSTPSGTTMRTSPRSAASKRASTKARLRAWRPMVSRRTALSSTSSFGTRKARS